MEQLTNYDGIMVPITEQDLNSTDSTAVRPPSDKATAFFITWIYFPLLIGMMYLLYCLTAYLIPK